MSNTFGLHSTVARAPQRSQRCRLHVARFEQPISRSRSLLHSLGLGWSEVVCPFISSVEGKLKLKLELQQELLVCYTPPKFLSILID